MTIFSVPAGDDLRINKEAIETTSFLLYTYPNRLVCQLLLLPSRPVGHTVV